MRTMSTSLPAMLAFPIEKTAPRTLSWAAAFLVRHSFLRAALAWDSFAEKNSTADFLAFKAKIMKCRSKNGKTGMGSGSRRIGATIGQGIIRIRQWAGVLRNEWGIDD